MALGAVVVLASAVGGCLPFSRHGFSPGSRVGVAVINQGGIPFANVTNLLKRSGIDAGIEGSIVYSVEVPASQAAEATRLIIADAKLRPYDYFQIPGYVGKLGMPDPASFHVRKFNVDLGNFEVDPAFRADPRLAGMANAAREGLKMMGQKKTQAGAFISGMKLFPMEYANANGGTSVGYYGIVELGYRSKKKSRFEVYAYSWDNGAHYEFSGGSSSD